MSVTTTFDSKSEFDRQQDAGEDTSVTDHVSQAAHAAVDKAAVQLAQAERALRDAQSAAGIKLSDVSSEALQIGSESISTVQDYIDQNPARSVGIAFAAGYLFSALLKK